MKTTYHNETKILSNSYVSIIFPVYNGSKYLIEAIDSVLFLLYQNFELIIIDDGSADNSAAIVESYADPRIRFYRQENQGLAATLNRGISLAKGKYIARQDQDDVSFPERFSKQVAFLDAHPDYGMVGTWAQIWEETTPTDRFHKHPEDNLSLKFDLLFDNAFVHSSLMIRKTVFDEVGVYSTDTNRQPPEDYELWSRVARRFHVANIPEVLHVYREIPRSMSRTGNNPFLRHLLKLNVENLSWATEGRYPGMVLQDVSALIHGFYPQFSGKTSFHELREVVVSAAHFLCSQENVSEGALQGQIRFRINNLRYHYHQAKHLGLLGDTGRRLLGNILRTGRRFLQKT